MTLTTTDGRCSDILQGRTEGACCSVQCPHGPCLLLPHLAILLSRSLSAEPLPSWGGDTKVVGSVEDVTAEGLEGGFGLSFERQLSPGLAMASSFVLGPVGGVCSVRSQGACNSEERGCFESGNKQITRDRAGRAT